MKQTLTFGTLCAAFALSIVGPGCSIRERDLQVVGEEDPTGEPEGTCVPSEKVTCTCSGDAKGSAICNSSGTAYSKCVCPGLVAGTYSSGDFSGPTWTVTDSGGSTIDPPCEGGPCFNNSFCARGTAAKVPLVNGDYDYANVWGTAVGWNFADNEDGNPGPPVSFRKKKSITIGLHHNIDATNTKMQLTLTLPEADGGIRQYCKSPLNEGKQVVALTDLLRSCWETGGEPFDPETMTPLHVTVQVLSETTRATPFDFCITDLSVD